MSSVYAVINFCFPPINLKPTLPSTRTARSASQISPGRKGGDYACLLAINTQARYWFSRLLCLTNEKRPIITSFHSECVTEQRKVNRSFCWMASDFNQSCPSLFVLLISFWVGTKLWRKQLSRGNYPEISITLRIYEDTLKKTRYCPTTYKISNVKCMNRYPHEPQEAFIQELS